MLETQRSKNVGNPWPDKPTKLMTGQKQERNSWFVWGGGSKKDIERKPYGFEQRPAPSTILQPTEISREQR